MKKALIIGGNRFFGKRLAKKLVNAGDFSVTLLNRGNREDDLGNEISRIKCDRDKQEQFADSLSSDNWDVVYDQTCYDYDQAKFSSELFNGRCKKYIFTSSQSVYPLGENLAEEIFSPESFRFKKKVSKEENYAEAKRQAEYSFHTYSKMPLILVRFPIVFGTDDYTERLLFHIERIREAKDIYIPNPTARLSLIDSDSAAETLFQLAYHHDITGPINAALKDPLSISEIIQEIEKIVEEKCVFSKIKKDENHSPYGLEDDWILNLERLNKLKLQIPDTKTALRKTLAELLG